MTPRPEESRHDAWWRVDDIAAVAAVRRAATTAAAALGFGEGRVAEVGIVASELATNLVVHAGGGELVLRSSALTDAAPELRLLAIDAGPGRRNIRAMITDGESSRGTLGIGLGACARIANRFDAHSVPGVGTVVELLLRADAAPQVDTPRVATLTRPFADEQRCGDTAAHRTAGDQVVVMLADGLGHGTLAADASRRAAEVFHTCPSVAPTVLLDAIHVALAGTRGAAVSVLKYDADAGEVTHAGVGNIAVRLLGASSQTLSPQPGIVGHRMPRVREVVSPVGPMRTAVLHSDGLTQRWVLDDLDGALGHSPGIVCAALMRTAASGRDDASVIAIGLGG